MEKIALYGNGALTTKLLYYNKRYCLYDIIAIIDDSETASSHNEVPVMSFIDFKKAYPVHHAPKILITIGYTSCNTVREKVFNKVISSGYSLTNFISPKANCWIDFDSSSNIIILDNVYVGPFCKIGNGVIICPGTLLSHGITVGDFSFFSDGVVVGGNAIIGKNSFVGLNSTIKSSTKLGEFNIVASAANVIRDSEPKSVLKGNPAIASLKDTKQIKI